MADYQEILSPNVYHDPHFDIDAAKILPGEYYATTRDMMIVTVLGSCVSACIRDRMSGIGGMNHFMLPGGGEHGPVSASARYGAYAMEILINHLLKLGARREHLEAKVFGGGRVLMGFMVANVGERNAEFVLDYLENENIVVTASDLLGTHPRKVYFFPRSGKVMVKKLKSAHNDTVIDRERDYKARLEESRVEGGVELF